MKLTGLLTRGGREALPGVSGFARVDRRVEALLRRLEPGEIAVLDQADLDRRTADALVAAGAAAVVNASPSISGRFPNLGPEVLLTAEIPLVDAVGSEVLRTLRDGTRIRIHEGVIYAGDREVARGVAQTTESIADQLIEAKAGMSAQLEAFSANTMEFLRRERSLILDGVGVPEVRVPIRDRQVLVVAPGGGYLADVKRLRRHIREYRPVLIGVEEAADRLCELGYRPDIIVGDPMRMQNETLKCGAEVVLPAHVDGFAPGQERVQDLGVPTVAFPASGNPEDLALLLADAHGATLVITVGFQATLHEFLDRGRSGSNPSTFLTRLKLGSKLVDGRAVATLHRSRVSLGAMVLLVLAALVVVAAALLVSDVGNVYAEMVTQAWHKLITWTEGLFP
ncbi:thiamin pyrophosphokinase [Longimycelium tulufanense]|uniref:Thiamin pyrophosphokinase n=1 Tax=Longimycelium tulufanense TaxID=907463 RepID=A0A8J3CJR6_9PSEU|nr:putative cytokinetic ring protein SteA [Longimycelium tulufanense]GGM79618.1 thiamin pyrophosphokinase [Longimycelium tulufanense]